MNNPARKAATVAAAPDASDRLQLMATFVCIVEAGNLSAAAERLRTTQPTVSRRLQTLERSLGVRLLQRSTHAMRLTVDGERCYARAKGLLDDWAAFEADLRGSEQEPEGCLRVVVPHAFGQEKFVAPLVGFMQRYPRVTVEWLLRDDTSGFIASGVDCALVVGVPPDPALVAIRLAEVPRIAVAAPALLEGRPLPQTPVDLQDLPWLAIRTYYRNEVRMTHAGTGDSQTIHLQPRLTTDSLYALRSATLGGLGVAVGSAWMLQEDLASGRLLHLVPAWQAAPLPVWIAYPHARFYPSRLRHFVAWMREAVPDAIG